MFKIENDTIRSFWKVISPSIIGFLIKQSYKNSRINRDSIPKQEKINFSDEIYFIIRNLGKGSGGTVELIYYIPDEQIYAMKLPFNNYIELIEREQKNYSKIQFSLIVRYYGYIEKVDKQKYLLLEYVDGHSLDGFDTSKLNYKEKLNIIFELMLTIQYIHSNEFI